MVLKSTILDEAAMRRALVRIAHEILERNRGANDLALVGIHRRISHTSKGCRCRWAAWTSPAGATM